MLVIRAVVLNVLALHDKHRHVAVLVAVNIEADILVLLYLNDEVGYLPGAATLPLIWTAAVCCIQKDLVWCAGLN